MTFNSHSFVIFFVAVLGSYWIVPSRNRNHLLLVASYLFYGWWDWRFLFLIAASTTIDFTLAKSIHRTSDQRRRLSLLWVSVVVNLGILGIFKYSNFFVESLESSARTLGWNVDGPTLSIILPVGISFYTFQTISYTFDVYRGVVAPTPRFLDFATYVAYFPQLVAGPIERAQRLLPRIEQQLSRTFPRGRDLERALSLILVGLFKKVVIADGVAPVVNKVFASPDELSSLAVLAGVIGFAIQIYGDFSGYTDMARGISELLGIDLVVNFREPYLSRNITEFWRRWHISLSNWLRDYLYIPLGGNRSGTLTTARNLMVTMLLGGLWHGASWNFVIWGGLHGFYLAIHKWLFGGSVPQGRLSIRDLPSVFSTFIVVNVAWVFFRADTLHDAFAVLRAITRIGSGSVDYADILIVALLLAAMFSIDLLQRRSTFRRLSACSEDSANTVLAGVAATTMVLAIVVFSGGDPQPFIYFQF